MGCLLITIFYIGHSFKSRSKRAVLRSSSKDGKSKFFKQRTFGLYFLAHLGWNLKFPKVGTWLEMSSHQTKIDNETHQKHQ